MSDLFPVPQKRGRAFSVYHMGVALVQGAALLIGGIVIHAVAAADTVVVPVFWRDAVGWQAVFLMIGAPGLTVGVARKDVFANLRVRRGGPSHRPCVKRFGLPCRAQKAFGFWMSGNALYAIVLFGFPAWMPTVFIRKFGMTAGDVGQIYGLIVACRRCDRHDPGRCAVRLAVVARR